MLALALTPSNTPMVRGPSLAPPMEGYYALAPLVVALLVISLVYAVRARRVRADSVRRGGLMASFALSVALGNALVEFNAMCDVTRPVAMAMERGEYERAPDGLGDGRLPGLHDAQGPRSRAVPRPTNLSRSAP